MVSDFGTGWRVGKFRVSRHLDDCTMAAIREIVSPLFVIGSNSSQIVYMGTCELFDEQDKNDDGSISVPEYEITFERMVKIKTVKPLKPE